MRTFIALAFLLFTPTSLGKVEVSDITVLQINAHWNRHHDVNLNSLRGCKVQYGLLERQNKELKNKIKYVPVVVVYKGNKAVRQWSADLSFKLNVDLEEIQQVIDKL
jgi:predicted class III extradiol MEMO1 family dioxygenase